MHKSNSINEKIVYAGSGIDYDKPSYKAIGLGEGHAAHGWGFYYAVDYDIADAYRQEAITGIPLHFFGKDYIVTDIRGFNDRFIDHGNIALDLVLKYCYETIHNNKTLNIDEIIDKLKLKLKYIDSYDANSSELNRAFEELQKINSMILDYVPDKRLKELQDLLVNWKSDKVADILDSDTIQRGIQQVEKEIEQEKINIENEYELNQLKELKAKWEDTIAELQNNSYYKDIRDISNMINFLNQNKDRFNTSNIYMNSQNEGVVKKVEIPDSPYLEESEIVKNQDDSIRSAINNVCLDLKLNDYEISNIYNMTGKDAYNKLCEIIRDKYGFNYKLKGNGKRADKIVSRLLNKAGIKGIHYFGEEDGECFVVFNQLDIKHINESIISERLETFDNITSTESVYEISSFINRSRIILRGIYDPIKELYAVQDASIGPHGDLFYGLYKQGWYPEFKNTDDVFDYYFKHIKLFMWTPFDNADRIIGSDGWHHKISCNNGTLILRVMIPEFNELIKQLTTRNESLIKVKDSVMNLRKLNEKLDKLLEYNVVQDGKFKFADVDVEALCNSVIPKELHYISNDEAQQVRDFLKLDEIETEEELRAIRNSIVRYITDKALELRPEQEELSKKWHEENPDGDFSDFMKQNPYDILWDQMSAFTHVIDMELHNRFGHV